MYPIIKKKKTYHTSFLVITFLGFYFKNSSFNRKYIAKVANPITKVQFLTIM